MLVAQQAALHTLSMSTSKSKEATGSKATWILDRFIHHLSTGCAWTVVFIPALVYYIHRCIHSHKFVSSSNSSTSFVLFKAYTPVSSHISIVPPFDAKVVSSTLVYLSKQGMKLQDASGNLVHPIAYNLEVAIGHEPFECLGTNQTQECSALPLTLMSPSWMHDPDLGRGYLLYSDVADNRIWRWEVGGGPITIGRTLHMDRSGCRRRDGTCVNNFQGSMAIVSERNSQKDAKAPLVVFERGERRIVRIEVDGARTPILTHLKDVHKPQAVTSMVYTSFGDLVLVDNPSIFGATMTTSSMDPGVYMMEHAYRIAAITAKQSKLIARDSEYMANMTVRTLFTCNPKKPILMSPYGLALSKVGLHRQVYVSDSSIHHPVIATLSIPFDNEDSSDDDSSDVQSSPTPLPVVQPKIVFDARLHESTIVQACRPRDVNGQFLPTNLQPSISLRGMTVDQQGNLWVAMAGGINAVLVLREAPVHHSNMEETAVRIVGCLSTFDHIPTGVELGDDGYLYITTSSAIHGGALLRLRVKAKRDTVPNFMQ